MPDKIKSLFKNQSGLTHFPVLVVLACSLVIGGAGYAYTRVSKAATVTHVNVATYNIRSQRWDGRDTINDTWAERRPRVKAIISNVQPGIIGMQEVIKRNPDTGAYVSQRNDVIDFMKPMGYNYLVGSVDNSSPIFWKSANFAKLTSGEIMIFNAATSTRSDPPATRYLNYARLQQVHDRKNVLVLNYHFNQFEQVDSQLTKLTREIVALRNKYPRDDIFFTGDFNKKHNEIVSRLNNAGVKIRVGDSYTGIDHVLISPGVSVRGTLNSGLGNPAASDHPMITAKLSI